MDEKGAIGKKERPRWGTISILAKDQDLDPDKVNMHIGLLIVILSALQLNLFT